MISARSRREAAAFSRFAWRCSGVSCGRATLLTSSWCMVRAGGQTKSSHVGDVVATPPAARTGPAGADRKQDHIRVAQPTPPRPAPRSTLQTSRACCSMLLPACCTGVAWSSAAACSTARYCPSVTPAGLRPAPKSLGSAPEASIASARPESARTRVSQSPEMSSGASSRSPDSRRHGAAERVGAVPAGRRALLREPVQLLLVVLQRRAVGPLGGARRQPGHEQHRGQQRHQASPGPPEVSHAGPGGAAAARCWARGHGRR